VVTLVRFGLMTGLLLGPADDRRVSPSLLPQKQIFLMGNLTVNIHGYWKQGALGAAGVRDGLQLGRSVLRTGGGTYCVATRTACLLLDFYMQW